MLVNFKSFSKHSQSRADRHYNGEGNIPKKSTNLYAVAIIFTYIVFFY